MLKDKFKNRTYLCGSIVMDKKEIDINGYERRTDIPMTKVGIFPYLGRTISPELEPDKIYQVLRPEEELTNPKTLKSLEEIPFVDEHTMIGKDFTPAEEKGIHGVTGKNVKVQGDLVTNDLIVFSDELKNLIDNGKRDLSMGYRCRYDLTPGEYKGQHYDAVQRDIIYNHIALVDEGRMGKECRVTDNAIVYDKLDIKQEKEFVKMSEKKITLDEDLKEEIKEEIKQELLNSGGENMEKEELIKKEEIMDKENPIEDEDLKKTCGDEDEDKRKLIDEVGGILKGKVDEELWRTIIGKVEKIAYNNSEAGGNDEDIEKEKEDEQKPVSMDSAIKYLADRDRLIAKIKPVIGENTKYSEMTTKEVVKYACDKLDIKNSRDTLEGYLKAQAKAQNAKVTLAADSMYSTEGESAVIRNYKKGE